MTTIARPQYKVCAGGSRAFRPPATGYWPRNHGVRKAVRAILHGTTERPPYTPATHKAKRCSAAEAAPLRRRTPSRHGDRHAPGEGSCSRTSGERIQRELIAYGESQDFAQLANRVIRCFYEVAVTIDGIVSLRSVRGLNSGAPQQMILGPTPQHLPRAARVLVDVLQQVTGEGSTEILFVHGHGTTQYPGVTIGAIRGAGRADRPGHPFHTIDLDDVEALGFQWELGEDLGGTAGALLAHEILEASLIPGQGEVDVPQEEFLRAHRLALEAEARAAGAVREARSDEHRVTNPTHHFKLSVYSYHYPDGRIVDLIVHYYQGNIVETRREGRPYREVRLEPLTYPRRTTVKIVTPIVENGEPRLDVRTQERQNPEA